jgi:DNA/RNA endonuclease YhcR with UshA esterase domain
MRNLKIIVGAVTVVLIVLLTAVTSRKQPDLLSYSAGNEITAAGTVEDVQEFYCPVTDDRGTHVMLKTDRGTILVHVAIARFLREHQFAIRPGERLQVTGAKIRYQGKEGMIAREIIRGDEIFTVRDTAGKPLWSN